MNRLSELISTMKLPIQRKEHFSKHNLMWLIRNIGVKNSDHKNFSTAVGESHKNYDLAVDEIKKRIQEKKYDD